MGSKQKFKNFILFKYPIISSVKSFPRGDKHAQTNLSSLIKHIAMLIKDDSGEMGVLYRWKRERHHILSSSSPIILPKSHSLSLSH